MSDWKHRLRDVLEPILGKQDPRPDLSSYREMPLCIFLYEAEFEFALRDELALLKTRLEQKGKHVTEVNLMDCMREAIERCASIEELIESEIGLGDSGHKQAAQTVHSILSDDYAPLDQIVLSKVPEDAEPERDILWITRAGALYPCYRTSTLIEHFQSRLSIPGVLFYPGEIVPPAGLSFMGIHEAEHNYRAKIL